MRGEDIQQHDLFSYGSLEQRVPADHPLRPIRTMVDEALKSLDGRFEEIYDEDGRKSIPPERLLRALLLQMLYTVRSERMLMEQLEYNLLFRWFVGLSANEPVWRPYSRRTGTGCWKGRWRKSSSPSWSIRRGRSGC